MADPTPDPVALAHAWVAHLVDGGTTPWTDVLAAGSVPGRVLDAEADTAPLPGAQQLEVVRQLNARSAADGHGTHDPRLAAEVFAVAPPGRGALDLPLVGLPARTYGARPVDPAALPAPELLRVATGVLAERLVGELLPDEPTEPAARRVTGAVARHLPRRRAFRLAGPAVRVDGLRHRLAELGRRPGGRDATTYVVGAGMGRLVTDAWTTRVLDGAAPSWPEWLATWADRDACPRRADLAATADAWAERSGGPGRVEVLLDPGVLADLLAVRGPVRTTPAMPAAAVELLRQVSGVLGVLVDRPRRSRLLTEGLRPRLVGAAGPPLVVPAAYADWLTRRGQGLLGDLRAGGYRVHGPTDLLEHPLTDASVPGVGEPDDDRVLALALDTLADRRTP
ncbi:hypothetical protein [uncultured Nocardioides sp.]|uniref:hypothetical protein n=1 Tax=uncultured Nocardioides sp. TaxID=198441 RepID=UPI0026332C80|nr:hypothetical protein [uncultured Nocardioides sp.]